MKKYPKTTGLGSFAQKSVVYIVVGEAFALVGGYLIYRRMNSDRDFRHFMRENCNWGLEVYYKTGEYLNSESNIRQLDQIIWEAEEKDRSAAFSAWPRKS